MQQIIQIKIQYIADLLGRIAVPMEIMIYLLGEFVQVGTEQFVLEQTCRLKKRKLFRCFFVDHSDTLKTTVTFSCGVKGTHIILEHLEGFLVVKTKNIIL